MIRITAQTETSSIRLYLEGKLSGESVTELERAWKAASASKSPVTVDLTAVSFIDPRGKQLLTKMFEKGTQLFSKGLMARCFIEEIESETK